METFFNASDRAAIELRLAALQPSSVRQWGKMNPGQAIAHCAAAMEMACGIRKKDQAVIGRIFAPFVKARFLGDKPFGRNGPTDPDLIVANERDLAAERARMLSLIDQFYRSGEAGAAGKVHSFFGRLRGDEWGRLMYKHLDHHLRQFGA